MKSILKYCTTSFLMVFTVTVHAQNAELYQNKIHHYHSMKNTGSIVMLSGIPVGIAGGIIYSNGLKKYNDPAGYDELESYFQIPAGIVITALGGTAFIGGLVLNIIGNKKMIEYQKKLKNLKLGTYCSPKAIGLSITYTF